MRLLLLLLIFGWSSSEDLQARWTQFKDLHQKSYHVSEESNRLKIFEDNLKKIDLHNEQYQQNKVSYKLGVNQFADLTSEEFAKRLNSHPADSVQIHPFLGATVPDSIDWREKGAVTNVKNSGVCASWGYSVTGALEGQNFIKTGKLVSLSEQELADCASEVGCSGGSAAEGYDYVIQHGLASSEDYPDATGTCHRGSIPPAVTENGYIQLVGNEEALKGAVAGVGPISVVVDASTWQFYVEGVISCQEANVNHGVLVVGYTSDYWLVKNSWGENWGENGYARVALEENCGITLSATYPV